MELGRVIVRLNEVRCDNKMASQRKPQAVGVRSVYNVEWQLAPAVTRAHVNTGPSGEIMEGTGSGCLGFPTS